jgi:hypothetical protein
MKKIKKTIEKYLYKNDMMQSLKIMQIAGDLAKVSSILYVYSIKIYMLCLKLLHIILNLKYKFYCKDIIENLR